jgi:hypothetical protein
MYGFGIDGLSHTTWNVESILPMNDTQLLTLEEAKDWASRYIGRRVSMSNISYLLQYGKIARYSSEGKTKSSAGPTMVSLSELKDYYDRNVLNVEEKWKAHLGSDVRWEIAFCDISEAERTKHVHRLHPYKGKFIPQLVEYFLEASTDGLKKDTYFQKGATVLDPFVGSGTTLVQCKELGLNSIGIDISLFNCLMTKVKVHQYILDELCSVANKAARNTASYSKSISTEKMDECLDNILHRANSVYYPSPEYKILIRNLRRLESNYRMKSDDLLETARNEMDFEINRYLQDCNIDLTINLEGLDENKFVNDFTQRYSTIVLNRIHEMIADCPTAQQELPLTGDDDSQFLDESGMASEFLSKWFTNQQLREMSYYIARIREVEDQAIQNAMRIILSRTVRSCRTTKHVDLATLVRPQTEPYYCQKHYKICRPVHSIVPHLMRYTRDTVSRIRTYAGLQQDVYCEVINADSARVDIFGTLRTRSPEFYMLLQERKIDGIFTSPPYLGMIDYHEQHAYAYELFGIERKDELEIGRMSNGRSQKAKQDYIDSISRVLINVCKYLRNGAHVFIVANDSHNLYPKIAERSGLEIVEEFKRPVLNRTERDKQPYSESIFHMMSKNDVSSS